MGSLGNQLQEMRFGGKPQGESTASTPNSIHLTGFVAFICHISYPRSSVLRISFSKTCPCSSVSIQVFNLLSKGILAYIPNSGRGQRSRMVDLTIAIPTYNGEHRLPAVLERLRSQIYPASLSVEVLVIDNNSRDRTAQVVQAYQKQFPFPLRCIHEGQQGAAFARRRAIEEASSDLIGFLDDDNLPDPDWAAAAWAFAQAHPQAGAWGSRIWAACEVPPLPALKPLLPFLAITDRGSHPLRYCRRRGVLPPSAGLVVRRGAWLGSIPAHTILVGRTEGNWLAGEDIEVLAYMQRSGWEIWYNPAMQMNHVIPPWRLERQYLIPLFCGIGLSRYVTRMAGLPRWQIPWMTIAYLGNDLRKLVQHCIRRAVHPPQTEGEHLFQDCRWELLKSSLASPFYLYRRGYLRQGPGRSPGEHSTRDTTPSHPRVQESTL